MEAHGIGAIDLLVVNLYPFEATVAAGADYDTAIENIDIGGPAMIRAAAKNHGLCLLSSIPKTMRVCWQSLSPRRRDHFEVSASARAERLCPHRRL